jgi:hypothetical protein
MARVAIAKAAREEYLLVNQTIEIRDGMKCDFMVVKAGGCLEVQLKKVGL